MIKKRLFAISAIALGALITLMLITAAIWPVISRVETGATPEYPELQPLYYSSPPERVFEEAERGLSALEGFYLERSDPATRTIEATALMPLFGFEHDVVVSVEPVTEFVTRVHTTSTSRVGKGDLGQNARHIRAVQRELEARLGAVRFDPKASEEGAAATIPATQ